MSKSNDGGPEWLRGDERLKIEKDPYLTVRDVVEYRRARRGAEQ